MANLSAPPPVMRRRLRIFAAALELFSAKGFDAVSIREIAQRAKVSKSLTSRHFASKEGLRAAVDAHVIERFEQLLNTILGPSAPPADSRETAAERAKRLNLALPDLLPLLKYLRHSLLENSEAGHTMFRKYVAALARHFHVEARPRNEPQLWLLLAAMFMQLGPIFLESHIEALTGRSPFHPDAVKARSLSYSRIEAQLRALFAS